MYDVLLPVVNPGIGGPMSKDLCGICDVPYLKKELKRLDEENPVVSQFIRKFSKTTKDRVGTVFCALIVYKMLENQAEANRMNLELGE